MLFFSLDMYCLFPLAFLESSQEPVQKLSNWVDVLLAYRSVVSVFGMQPGAQESCFGWVSSLRIQLQSSCFCLDWPNILSMALGLSSACRLSALTIHESIGHDCVCRDCASLFQGQRKLINPCGFRGSWFSQVQD